MAKARRHVHHSSDPQHPFRSIINFYDNPFMLESLTIFTRVENDHGDADGYSLPWIIHLLNTLSPTTKSTLTVICLNFALDPAIAKEHIMQMNWSGLSQTLRPDQFPCFREMNLFLKRKRACQFPLSISEIVETLDSNEGMVSLSKRGVFGGVQIEP
jgi:hypothetical protein